jgi:hypothetical protein
MSISYTIEIIPPTILILKYMHYEEIMSILTCPIQLKNNYIIYLYPTFFSCNGHNFFHSDMQFFKVYDGIILS